MNATARVRISYDTPNIDDELIQRHPKQGVRSSKSADRNVSRMAGMRKTALRPLSTVVVRGPRKAETSVRF